MCLLTIDQIWGFYKSNPSFKKQICLLKKGKFVFMKTNVSFEERQIRVYERQMCLLKKDKFVFLKDKFVFMKDKCVF